MIYEAILSSEISLLTRATRRHIPEDGIRHENNLFLMPGIIFYGNRTLGMEGQVSRQFVPYEHSVLVSWWT
jgi:hypothetical protein